MASKRLIIAGMLLLCLIPLLFFGEMAAVAAGSEQQTKIAFKNGLVYLDAQEVEIGELLKALAGKAGIGLTVGEGVVGRISLKLKGVAVEVALSRISANRAIVYEYDADAGAWRILSAGAFATGKEAAATRVQPPHAEASAAAAGKSSAAVPQSPEDEGERLYDSQGRLLYKPRELLVRFRPEATAEQIAALHRTLGSTVLKTLDYLKLHRIRLREGLSEKGGMALYGAAEIVAAVERHGLRYPLSAPNDPYYVSNSQWSLTKIQMPAAWDVTTGSAGIVVAVIDTGVDYTHPDLAANIWTNSGEIAGNGMDDDGDRYLDDVRGWDFTGNGDNNPMDPPSLPDRNYVGHGTHVAGIIAAAGNNGIGVTGVGWTLRLMPLKVLADNSTEMLIIDIVEALDYARVKGARIVNCSFGGESASEDPNEKAAFERLRQAGILAVCAAGNYGTDNDGSPRMYPASYTLDNIVSVAASLNNNLLGEQENLLGNSNYGRLSVDLMAPGEAIWSTCFPVGTVCTAYYDNRLSGTSMAAPHVSGVAGLILSRNPHLSYTRVKSVILETVDMVETGTKPILSGGRLNAAAALEQTCLPGDLTGNGWIGLEDVIMALRIVSKQDLDSPVRRTADADGDDRLGLTEAIYDLAILSGLRN